MGIQINGQTDTVTSTTAGGRVTVTPASFPSVNNINATGISTFSGGLLVGTGASISSPATNVLTLGTNNTESVRINSSGYVGIGSATPGFQVTVDQGTTDGSLVDIKNEEVRLLTGVWGTGSTYPREVTLNATRFDSGALPALRLAGQGGIKFAVDLNTVRMEIDSSGRVTTPYQPSFSVWLNGNQDIAHNTLTKVRFNAEVFDVGGNFDSSTNYRFTAPVAGKYLFMGHLYIYPTYQVEVYTYKNGSQYKRFSGPLGSGGNDNPNGLDFLDIIDLAVNDYVEIYGLQARTGDSATISIYGGGVKESSFVGYLIG